MECGTTKHRLSASKYIHSSRRIYYSVQAKNSSLNGLNALGVSAFNWGSVRCYEIRKLTHPP